MKLLPAVLLFAAMPILAFAEQTKPSTVCMTTDGDSVAGLNGEIQVSLYINIVGDAQPETHIRIRQVMPGALNLDLNSNEANALAVEFEWAAGTAENGQNIEKKIWGDMVVVTLNSHGLEAASIRNAKQPELAPISLTATNAHALAAILKRVAGNAEWLEARAPELMKD